MADSSGSALKLHVHVTQTVQVHQQLLTLQLASPLDILVRKKESLSAICSWLFLACLL